MKPTVQAPDFYMIGNDYAQAPLSSFYDMSTFTSEEASARGNPDLEGTLKYYQDGIFTKLSDGLSGKDIYGKDDAWKDEKGFNKRRVYVNKSAVDLDPGVLFNTSSTNPLQPAADSEQYATADVVDLGNGSSVSTADGTADSTDTDTADDAEG